MDDELRSYCLMLFEACIAQIRSGKPNPSILTSREFEVTLTHLCERLRAEPTAHPEASEEECFKMELIVSANLADASNRMDRLRSWLRGAKEVTVCDPYLLRFRATEMYPDAESYAEAFTRLFPPTTKRINLYTNSYDKKIRPKILRPLKEGREVRHFSSHGLHDRFIVKDRSEGKILGTSFGGFGNKFFAMIDLPPGDVAAVQRELHALCPEPIRSRLRG